MLVMILVLFILLALLGPLAYLWGVDSRIRDPRDKRGWI
jgi:nitrogen fixation-related uncharacterized protein